MPSRLELSYERPEDRRSPDLSRHHEVGPDGVFQGAVHADWGCLDLTIEGLSGHSRIAFQADLRDLSPHRRDSEPACGVPGELPNDHPPGFVGSPGGVQAGRFRCSVGCFLAREVGAPCQTRCRWYCLATKDVKLDPVDFTYQHD